MEFNETLLHESHKFRQEYPDLINLGIDIDEYLISIFENSFTDKHHQSILRLTNAFRRNFLLASFLFESKQWNVWVQAARTMIESWELLILYILNNEVIYNEIENSEWKSNLDNLLLKYATFWISNLKDKELNVKIEALRDVKKKINDLLTHVNPLYNLMYAAGFDVNAEQWILAWYIDTNLTQALSNYVLLTTVFFGLVEVVSYISPLTDSKRYLSPTFNKIPDFHIERYFEKYVPHWLE